MKRLAFFLIILFFGIGFIACEKEKIPSETEQTLFVYMPWSTDLLPFFNKNISDLESAIKQKGLKNERVIVFLSTSETEATLFEIKYRKGNCTRETIRIYTNPPFTTVSGITSILKEVTGHAPAGQYSMVVGSHGMAWIPATATTPRSSGEKEYWEYEGPIQTRWFGGKTYEYQTDITTLAEALAYTGIKMEYILFDDCYMSSIEVAYDLKEVTNYLIASPCEMLIAGMPYAAMGSYLLGEINYEGICNAFVSHYQNTSDPYATIGVINCKELDHLAAIMKEINGLYTFNHSLPGAVQRMDGYSPIRFFDYGDYVAKLCTDPDLLSRFEAQLERTVPSRYRMHTDYFYSMSNGINKINTYTGATISDPSISSVTTAKTETAWYKATH